MFDSVANNVTCYGCSWSKLPIHFRPSGGYSKHFLPSTLSRQSLNPLTLSIQFVPYTPAWLSVFPPVETVKPTEVLRVFTVLAESDSALLHLHDLTGTGASESAAPPSINRNCNCSHIENIQVLAVLESMLATVASRPSTDIFDRLAAMRTAKAADRVIGYQPITVMPRVTSASRRPPGLLEM